MTLSSDAKFGIGIIIATVIIIGGGAWLASRNADTGTTSEITVSQPDRLVREDDPKLGATDNPTVTVVEFGDFECPACGTLHVPLKATKAALADKSVQFVFRQYPLPQHQFADLAAEASLAAQAQGKFWEFHNLMYENQEHLTQSDLEGYAQQLELNMDEFKQALSDHTYRAAINQDTADGRALQVNSTPTLFINGKKYEGAFTQEALTSAIEAELPSN